MTRQQNIESLISRFDPRYIRTVSANDEVAMYMYSIIDVTVSGEYKDVKFGYSENKDTLYIIE